MTEPSRPPSEPSSPGEPARRARVLIATASVGAGHNSVARALIEQLRQTAPDIEVDCQDVIQFCPRLFRAYYAGGFAVGMSRLPRGYGFGYWLSNHPQGPRRGLVERLRLLQERHVTGKFTRYVLDRRWDLIVNVHFLAAPALAHLMRKGRLATPQVTVVTDIEVHRFWYSQGVEHWFVPAEYSAQPLLRWGIEPRRITVSGIPIHPKWVQPLDRAKVLADWDLPGDRPILVLSGGTEFVCVPVPKIASAILQACPDAHVVILAGRNKKLLAELGAMAADQPRLRPLSFTDRAHELLEVCSLMLTKAGGITTAECLAKGVPMVLLKPVPGQEGGNANYLARQGAAVIANDLEQTVAQAAGLLADRAALAAMAAKARGLYKPATQTIASAICRMARPARP